MTNLGIQNGWGNEIPAEYTRHINQCGVEHEVKNYLGSAKDDFKLEKVRQYNMDIVRHRTHEQHTCKDCKITYASYHE